MRHELWFLERMVFQGKVSEVKRVDSLEGEISVIVKCYEAIRRE